MYSRQPPAERRTRTADGIAVLRSHRLGPHPVIHHFLERLHLPGIINAVLGTPRTGMRHDQAVEVLIHNILVSPGPLYRVGEWLAPLEAHTLGLTADDQAAVNDDRLARTLDALASERGRNLFFRLAVHLLKEFDLTTDRVHFDTTSVTFHGAYETSKGSPQITHGVNKDHRPDLKQLLFGLNVVGDAAVPITHHLWSGNQSDSTVHEANVQELRRLLSRTDFVYVADSKLCSTRNLEYIDKAGGQFVTVMPRTRREDVEFRKHLQEGGARWYPLATQRQDADESDQYYSCRGLVDQTADGYRLIWIKSWIKADQDRTRREGMIAGAMLSLHGLSQRLNRRRLKTQEQIETAVDEILKKHKVSAYLNVSVVCRIVVKRRYISRGRPTATTPILEIDHREYDLHIERNDAAIQAHARTDGVFPLITNLDDRHGKSEILEIYKYQPYVEKRFALLKTELGVAPVSDVWTSWLTSVT